MPTKKKAVDLTDMSKWEPGTIKFETGKKLTAQKFGLGGFEGSGYVFNNWEYACRGNLSTRKKRYYGLRLKDYLEVSDATSFTVPSLAIGQLMNLNGKSVRDTIGGDILLSDYYMIILYFYDADKKHIKSVVYQWLGGDQSIGSRPTMGQIRANGEAKFFNHILPSEDEIPNTAQFIFATENNTKPIHFDEYEIEDCKYVKIGICRRWRGENAEMDSSPYWNRTSATTKPSYEPPNVWIEQCTVEYEILEPDYHPVPQSEYIIVYDMTEKQDGFKSNGEAIISPTKCEIIEELNGSYYAEIEHPIDEDEKWRSILEYNIVKIRGQLFTIRKVTQQWRGNSGKVYAYAEHIFYQQNDYWIYPDHPFEFDGHISNGIGRAMYLAKVSYDESTQEDQGLLYEFAYKSDCTVNPMISQGNSEVYGKWTEHDGFTQSEIIMGPDGMIANAETNAFLYRDNFYFSVMQKMENMQENAFDIRVGLNLTGIKRTVDVTTFASYLRGYSNDGGWFGIAWTPASIELRVFPHKIVRSVKYDYSWDDFDKLVREVYAYWGSTCAPSVVYEVDLIDVTRNKDFEYNSMRFKVGDTGRIYDIRFGGPVTLTIQKTITDGITGRVTKVVFGNMRSFTRPYGYPGYIEPEFAPNPAGAENMLVDCNGVKVVDRNETEILVKWEVN